jgi:hypothetical protein
MNDTPLIVREKLKNALFDVLKELTIISEDKQEIFDSDVRENMANAVFDGFLKPDKGNLVPNEFGMASEDGNALVKAAIEKYIKTASELANQANLSFHERLAAFQDHAVCFGEKQLRYSFFFGYYVPECYDREGNLKNR